MLTHTLLNVIKGSLKSLYDIDPLVVDHMTQNLRLQLHVAGRFSAGILQVVGRTMRSGKGLTAHFNSAA